MKIHLTLKCFDIFVDILCGLYLCFTGMFPAKIPEPSEAAGVGSAQFFHHIVQQELESEKKVKKKQYNCISAAEPQISMEIYVYVDSQCR